MSDIILDGLYHLFFVNRGNLVVFLVIFLKFQCNGKWTDAKREGKMT